MNLQRAANYMRGTVRLEATGPYPERFFNICSARGIRFWAVERVDDNTLRLTVPLSQARRARALGAKSLCDVRIVGREGAPRLAMDLLHRYGMLLGLVVSLAAVLVLSRFVLVIDITGNTTVSAETIRAELAEIGLDIGTYGPSVNARAISNRALMDLEELGFLSVNLHGIRAEVVVREKDPVPELAPTGVAIDLIAAKGGTVLDTLSLAGEPLVEAEDEVSAGDVLISGTVSVRRKDDPNVIISTYPVIAKGYVWARVEETFSAALPLHVTGKQYTGERAERYRLTILGKSFQISKKIFQPFAEYDKIKETHTLTLGDGLELPLSLTKEICLAYQSTDRRVDRVQGEALLRGILSDRLTRAIGDDGEILAQDWTVEERSGALYVTLRADCREQIAVSAEDGLQEPGKIE